MGAFIEHRYKPLSISDPHTRSVPLASRPSFTVSGGTVMLPDAPDPAPETVSIWMFAASDICFIRGVTRTRLTCGANPLCGEQPAAAGRSGRQVGDTGVTVTPASCSAVSMANCKSNNRFKRFGFNGVVCFANEKSIPLRPSPLVNPWWFELLEYGYGDSEREHDLDGGS